MSKTRRGLLDFDDQTLSETAPGAENGREDAGEVFPQLGRRAGAVKDMAESIALLEEDATRRAELELLLRNGQQVVALDPDLFDPSPIRDRIDNDVGDLIPSIREHGQRTPILARPHPTQQGRYQIAFGNRRQQVCLGLGMDVRAIILELTDEQMAVAQGQENTARQDLTYIEQARFVAKLKEKHPTSVVVSAINAEETTVYKMLKIVGNIPDELILAIGRAPKIGRPRWEKLSQAIANPDAARTAMEAAKRAASRGRTSEARFEAAFESVVEPKKSRDVEISFDGGRTIANRRTTSQGESLVIKETAFMEHLLSHLPDLYRQYLATVAPSSEPQRMAAE